jgi:hypothetical protein
MGVLNLTAAAAKQRPQRKTRASQALVCSADYGEERDVECTGSSKRFAGKRLDARFKL